MHSDQTEEHAGVFSEISQLLVDTTNSSGFKHLHKFVEHSQLTLICDVKGRSSPVVILVTVLML
jgi:hypothetical protein